MKFAALAREVYTTPTHAPIQRVLPSSLPKQVLRMEVNSGILQLENILSSRLSGDR